MVTSWLDTVLSLFLHNVVDVFPDFWTNDCHLLAYSFFQLGDSLGNILVYSFIKVTPGVKAEVWKVRWPSCLFDIPNRQVSFLWNRWRRSDMLSSNSVVICLVVLSGLWVQLYHMTTASFKKKISPPSGFLRDLGL